jgi:L,D-transpeptidase ErfK/SrfK
MSVVSRSIYLTFFSVALAGVASAGTYREDVVKMMVDLRVQGVKERCAEEYRNFEATYAIGEAHLIQEDRQGAEDSFREALAKGRALESEYAGSRVTRGLPPSAVAVPAEGAPGSESLPVRSELIIGGEKLYKVKKGDTLRLIGAKYGVSKQVLAKLNGLDPKKPLRAGQVLRLTTRHIIPKKVKDGLVINIADCTLYYFRDGALSSVLPVALGRPKSKRAWRTPTGDFRILSKVKGPTWRVPPSIRKEMEEMGEKVVTEVPPGPRNPLGKFAIRTSIPGIMIHSTTSPASIYGFSSHGCIRVFPDRMEELFKEVRVNTRGEIIYQPVKIAVTEGGRVYLEVHDDVYRKVDSLEKEAREAIEEKKMQSQVDWKKVGMVLQEKTGIAEDVSL